MIVHINDTMHLWLLTQFANDDAAALGALLDWIDANAR